MQPTYDYDSFTFNPKFRSAEFTPTILKRQKFDLEEVEYFKLLKSGRFLKNDMLATFLTQFPKIFTSLLNKCSDDNERKKLSFTPLCKEYCETLPDKSMLIHLYMDTKPIIFAIYSGNIQLLKSINELLPDSYNLRLSNNYNLLHCLVEGECPNVENSKLCINFLLGKNTEMINERDVHNHTPLDLCSKTLQILEDSISIHKNSLENLRSNLKQRRSSPSDDQKLQITLANNVSDLEIRAKNLTTIHDFLEKNAINIYLKQNTNF